MIKYLSLLGYMSNMYRSIFPLSQRDTYTANQTVDFLISMNNEKLVPGSLYLEGKCNSYITGNTEIVGYNDICYDPHIGYHSLIREITTEFERGGVVENLQSYPRLVKMRNLCTVSQNSLGTETWNAVEGIVANPRITKAIQEGPLAADRAVPFSLQLQCVANKASGPLSGSAIGQVRMRIRLAPNDQFFYGKQATSNTNYSLSGLKLRYQVIPDDGKLQPVQLEYYHTYRAVLDSTNQNVSTFVPGLCDSVHMSCIKVDNETEVTQNYNQCEPPVGIPPLWETTEPVVVTSAPYGFERVYYAVNDTDTALVGFTMESREEILLNGIRSFNPALDKYNTLLRLQQDPQHKDGYVAGIPFGGLIDFSKNKFAVELQSQADSGDNSYALYLAFRQLQTIEA